MICFKNSKGKTYYLKIGTTKTGKPRYFASTDPDKLKNCPEMPKGYEFRENVNGQVSVGKIQARHIDPSELESIKPILDQLEVTSKAEIKGKSIIIHTSRVGESLKESPLFKNQHAALKLIRESAAIYQPMLKFTLFDKDPHDYQAERKCFMGEMPWLPIGEIAPLETLAKKYIPLLDDDEALFEEIY